MRALEANKKLLQFFNMWPQNGSSFKSPKFIIKLVIGMCYIQFFVFGNFMNLVQIRNGNSKGGMIDWLDNFCLTSILAGFGYIVICFIQKHDKVNTLLDMLNDFSRFSQPTNFVALNKKIDKLMYWYIIYTFFGTIYYCSLTLIDIPKCKAAYGDKKICTLVTQLWYPFEIKYPAIMFVCQVVASLEACTAAVSLFGLICSVCENIVMRIHKLKELLAESCTGDDQERMRKLIYCVKYHNFIMEITDLANDCFSMILFLIISLFSAVMGVVAFQFSVQPDFKTLVHFGGWFMTLLLLSFMGQRLINESNDISEEIYNIDWYKENVKAQKLIKQMLVGSLRPLKLRAGKFECLSFPTLQMILKNTYSCVALLNMTVALDDSVK